MTHGTHGHKLSEGDAIAYILGGNATFTIENPTTKKYHTFKVKQAKDVTWCDKLWFVRLRSDEYIYIGYIYSKKGVLTFAKGKNKTAYKGEEYIRWAVKAINKKRLKANIYHFGTCGVCGRTLTTPESIQIGIGPYCRGK